MKKIYGTLAFISFFILYGTVGASECDTISLQRFIIQSAISIICLFVFTKLAGGFDNNYTYQNTYELYNCKDSEDYSSADIKIL